MTRLVLSLGLVGSLLFVQSCYRYSVQTGAPPATAQRSGAVKVTWLWGLVGTGAEAPECPHGVSYTETYQPWWGGLVGILTLGIVNPWRGEWICAAGNQQQAIPTTTTVVVPMSTGPVNSGVQAAPQQPMPKE